MLRKLAAIDDRDMVGELKWLIKSRAMGRLKDLGDERITPLVHEADLPHVIHAQRVTLEREPEHPEFVAPGNRDPRKPPQE